jgi:hypothetical protein
MVMTFSFRRHYRLDLTAARVHLKDCGYLARFDDTLIFVPAEDPSDLGLPTRQMAR